MPRTSVLTPGGLKEITRWQGLHLGINRLFRSLRVMSGGTLRHVGSFIPPLSLSVSPDSASGGAFSGQVNTNTVKAIASGGQAPYSYAWSLVSDTAPGTPFATSPTGATTAFRGYVEGDAQFRVIVTDSLGSTQTALVPATFTSFA